MSQENVEIVRRAHQAFNDRDLDALLASFTDDAEWRLIGGFADLIGTEFRGLRGCDASSTSGSPTLDSKAKWKQSLKRMTELW